MFFFNDTAHTDIYTYCHTLSLHDALPIYEIQRNADPLEPDQGRTGRPGQADRQAPGLRAGPPDFRSEEHTSELQSLMRISYAVFCLKKKNNKQSSIISLFFYIIHAQYLS